MPLNIFADYDHLMEHQRNREEELEQQRDQEKEPMTDTRTDSELNAIITCWSRSLCPKSDVSVPDTGEVIPSYCTNQGAIREAVLKLKGDDRSLWYDILSLACPEDPEADLYQMKWLAQWFVAVEANARQRSEALVAVIEKETK